jgi:S1-C subfamily serine protease
MPMLRRRRCPPWSPSSPASRCARAPLADDPLFRRYFPDLDRQGPQRQTSLGSGVIVSPEGYVITNHHVIEGADDIQLALSDGRRISAKVRGTDLDTDLAVLKADADNLPAITLGHAEDLQVGDVVLAIGNPYGFGGTVTSGIVSALGRTSGPQPLRISSRLTPRSTPQFRRRIIDTAGNLIGINSMIARSSIERDRVLDSVSLARNVFEQIIRDGNARLVRHRAGGDYAGAGQSTGAACAGRGADPQRAARTPPNVPCQANDVFLRSAENRHSVPVALDRRAAARLQRGCLV